MSLLTVNTSAFALSSQPDGLQTVDTVNKQPNIIFIFTDDQRFNSLTMTGDPLSPTEHIDQLAKEGVFFDNAFITSPICGPSRANMFTGQWERKNKIGFHTRSHNVITKEVFDNSWLMQLKKQGYSTAFIGKHHTKIADKNDTPLRENIDFAYFGNGHLGFHFKPKFKAFSNLKNKTQVEGLMEATKAYLSQNKDFDYFYENAHPSIKNSIQPRDPKKPFAAWINFNLPHASSIGTMGSLESDPLIYKTLFQDKIDEIELPAGYPVPISLPKEVYGTRDLMKYYVTSNKKKLLNDKLKMARAVYAMDLFVGELRQQLKRMGEDQNTIIVFASDNGLLLGEHGLGGKTILYDESVHVPLIIYSPFFDANTQGKHIDELVVGQDIVATLLDMAGANVPSSYQGESLVPLIEGTKTESPWRQDIFLENLFTDQGYPRQEGVRDKKFKYIRSFSKKQDRMKYLPARSFTTNEEPIYEELFDIVSDPNELTNLANDPKYAKELEYYRDRAQTLVKELY
ncbi:MAG: sulfatase-like hydrolase/transferase [Aliiglaciecola sp.]|uniref:sulfatase-like hydrolase/transferase n=1 Tax=Aliiglaciecola sp. TaxID=1872441 RepID=UPI003299161F